MKKINYLRSIILGTILIGLMIINYLHLHGGSQYPSVHAICPLGGIENLWAWIAGHSNLQKLFSGTMTLFFFTIIFALLFGRAFCGNICPFGFLQEIISKISKKKFHIPKNVDGIMRFLKYILLAFITFMAWKTATLWISPYDPYTAFAHIWSGAELFAENGIGFIILVVVILASIFIDRFFCKYLCPAGALYGIISKISPSKVKRSKCRNCSLCEKNCPMGIEISENAAVRSAECIKCGKCIESCPSKTQDINFTLFGRTMKPMLFTIVTVVVFFISLVIFQSIGLMRVTVPTVESVIENQNYLKAADLRGSMTIEDGAMYTGMELSAFYELMEIPQSVPKDTLLKYVSQYVPGYDFHAVKAKK